MNSQATLDLITNGLSTFGTSILAILGAVLVIAIGYLVFRFGYKKIRYSLDMIETGNFGKSRNYDSFN